MNNLLFFFTLCILKTGKKTNLEGKKKTEIKRNRKLTRLEPLLDLSVNKQTNFRKRRKNKRRRSKSTRGETNKQIKENKTEKNKLYS